MNIPTTLKDKFPYTVGYTSWLIIVGGVSATLAQATPDDQDRLKSVVILIAYFLVGVGIMIFLFELISKLAPGIKPLLSLLLLIPKLIFKTYVLLLAFILRPVVADILENKITKDSSETLKKLPGQDDSYIDDLLDFDNLRNTKIKFSSPSAYWRFGIKFSRDINFNPSRLESNYPLYHLAKDEKNNIVYRVYYDENKNQRQNENIVENYDGSPLILEIDEKNGLRITVKDSQGDELKSEKFPINLHKFGKIFAWGDGRDYSVKANIEKRKKS